MSAVDLETRNLAALLGPPNGQDRPAIIQKMRTLDETLCMHAELVADSVKLVADRLRLAVHDRAALIDAAWLHDIGKLTISTETLNKPGPLDDDQWTEMRKHPDRGADYLASTASLEPIASLVRHHHERYDGSGYPSGLAGSSIPLGSRIICIVDAYDAMTSERPYRRTMSPAAALDEIRRCAGAQFDSEIVTAFLSIVPALKKGSAA